MLIFHYLCDEPHITQSSWKVTPVPVKKWKTPSHFQFKNCETFQDEHLWLKSISMYFFIIITDGLSR